MKIATWNVNSLRARADRVEEWLDRHEVDVLTIQETKCKDENFPWEVFERLGYAVAHFGFSQWNGVAIASRVGLEEVERTFPNQPAFGKGGVDPVQEARAMSALVGTQPRNLSDGNDGTADDGKAEIAPLRVWSLYVPNGRALHDEHMPYKLAWLARLRDYTAQQLAEDPHARLLLTGDWNVAPQDEDVWDMQFFLDNELTHVSPAERDAFAAFLDAGLTDVVRPDHPGPETYTYWDYQQLRFPKNQGMRIDFQLASASVAQQVRSTWIDRDERKGKGASDHVPVVIELG